MFLHHALLATVAGVALFSVESAADDVLETIRTNHRAAVQSIQTFHCQVTQRFTPPNPVAGEAQTGEYWRSLDAVRVRIQGHELRQDVLVRNSRVTTISKSRLRDGRPNLYAGLKQGETSNSTGDVWALGLLSFFGPEFTWVSLDDLLAKPHQLRKVKRSQERDRVFFYLDLTHEKGRLELWFDPQVNFLVRRLVLTSNFPGAGEKRAENEVVRFKEVAPAIYFPEQVELQVYKDAKVESKRSVTFSNIRVNQPLPAEVFRLRFPDGVNLVDSIQGRMYKVDAEGREIGPARDEKGAELHLAKSPPFPADTSQQANLTQTQEEPQPAAERLAHWVVLLSLVILASAGGLWLRWRKRPMPA